MLPITEIKVLNRKEKVLNTNILKDNSSEKDVNSYKN